MWSNIFSNLMTGETLRKLVTGPVGEGGASKTAPGKASWKGAPGEGTGGRGVCTKAEVVPAAQLEPGGRWAWQKSQVQTRRIWYAPKWSEILSPARWGALERACARGTWGIYQKLRELGSEVKENYEGWQLWRSMNAGAQLENPNGVYRLKGVLTFSWWRWGSLHRRTRGEVSRRMAWYYREVTGDTGWAVLGLAMNIWSENSQWKPSSSGPKTLWVEPVSPAASNGMTGLFTAWGLVCWLPLVVILHELHESFCTQSTGFIASFSLYRPWFHNHQTVPIHHTEGCLHQNGMVFFSRSPMNMISYLS